MVEIGQAILAIAFLLAVLVVMVFLVWIGVSLIREFISPPLAYKRDKVNVVFGVLSIIAAFGLLGLFLLLVGSMTAGV